MAEQGDISMTQPIPVDETRRYDQRWIDYRQRVWDLGVSHRHTLIEKERTYYKPVDESFHKEMVARHGKYTLNKYEEGWMCTWRRVADEILDETIMGKNPALLVNPVGYIVRSSFANSIDLIMGAYAILLNIPNQRCTPTDNNLERFTHKYIDVLEKRKKASLQQAGVTPDNAGAVISTELELYMNRYFAMIETEQVIYVKTVINNELRLKVYNIASFRSLYPAANVTTIIDSTVDTTACQYWLRSQQHASFSGIDIAISTDDDTLNLFSGLLGTRDSLKDVDKEEALLLLKHIYEVWCKRNDVYMEYLLGWLAHSVQYPCIKMKVALALMSVEGAGKGIIVEKMRAIYGKHFKSLNMESVTGQFNGQLLDCLLLFLDEAVYSGDKASIGKLKKLITEPTIEINQKYVNGYITNNKMNIIIATNNVWAAPVERTDRRYFVLECSSEHATGSAEDTAYFDRLAAIKPEAFLKYLLELDISGFRPTQVPITDAHRIQKEIGLDAVSLWWLNMLRERNTMLFSNTDDSVVIPKGNVYAIYTKWHNENITERYIEPSNRFWIVMKTMTGVIDRRTNSGTVRTCCVVIPQYDVAKQRFGIYVKDPELVDHNTPIDEE